MSGEHRAVVWVDGWQMACCGTPFQVGDSIDWTVSREVDREFLERVTTREVAEGVGFAEQHHEDDGLLLGLTGVVRSIRLASCRYQLDKDGGSSPAAGSGQLRSVATTAERPPSNEDEDRPGWVVEVEPLRIF